MNNQSKAKPKLAFIIEHSDYKGYYPFERAAILAQQLQDEQNLFIFLKNASKPAVDYFTRNNLTPVLFDNFKELTKMIRNLEVDVIIYDGPDSNREQTEWIRPFCQTLIHFDDFGEGATLADFRLNALYEEKNELREPNELFGSHFFVASAELENIRKQRTKQLATLFDNNPHVAIYYEDGDANNLTYRTLRHLIQLQIPLKISVLIDDHYLHSLDDLTMMALSRKNITIVRGELAIQNALITADCLICNHLYTPFKAAYIRIPCITAAQHEKELALGFASEDNGFLHIGLGRKMKQSHIQNALMELILHDSIRKRTILLQQNLKLEQNEGRLKKMIVDIMQQHDPFSPSI